MGPTADPAVVDLDRVADWMDQHGLHPGHPIEHPTALSGGTQNVLVRFRRGGQDLVLRRPPHPKRPHSDRSILREAKVVEALRSTGVPHPRFVARCDDPSVIGAAFYVMEAVDGSNPAVHVPPVLATDPSRQRRLGGQIVDVLLTLARVQPAEIGLADLGRPEGWAERQTARWWKQLTSYDTWTGDPDRLLPGVSALRDWMDAHPPRDVQIGLVHGDLHLANVMLAPHGGEVTALVDWELATQADPLLDLGHLLATWPAVDDASIELATPLPALPTVEEVADRYMQSSGRDPADLAWFRALACYRLAIILQGGFSRFLAGHESADVGERARIRSTALIVQALDRVA